MPPLEPVVNDVHMRVVHRYRPRARPFVAVNSLRKPKSSDIMKLSIPSAQ